MANPNPKISQLKKYTRRSPDTNGSTQQVQGRVEPELKGWIKEQPHSESVLVRHALRLLQAFLDSGLTLDSTFIKNWDSDDLGGLTTMLAVMNKIQNLLNTADMEQETQAEIAAEAMQDEAAELLKHLSGFNP